MCGCDAVTAVAYVAAVSGDRVGSSTVSDMAAGRAQEAGRAGWAGVADGDTVEAEGRPDVYKCSVDRT